MTAARSSDCTRRDVMKRLRSWLVFRLGLELLFGAVVACGSRASPGGGGHGIDHVDGNRQEPGSPGHVGVGPGRVHAGYDGVHTFRAPMSAAGRGLTWSIADASIATIEPAPSLGTALRSIDDPGGDVVVTALRPGTTTITVKAGDAIATSTLVVHSYPAASYAVGERRYNMPADTSGPRAACASCHGVTNGVDQSPTIQSSYTDDDLLSAITTGKYKDGSALRGVDHAMNLTAVEKQGIVAYLRALPPRS